MARFVTSARHGQEEIERFAVRWPANGCLAGQSLLRGALAARTEESLDTGRYWQARFYPSPQFRHAPVAVGYRHPHGVGITGAF